jgi:rhodanese-related sulfurtransferase
MSTMKEISVKDVKDDLARYRLIDVRETYEWNGDLGHIKGAQLVPMGNLPALLDQFSKTEEILLICRSGNRSGMVGQLMASKGYQVTNLLGGMISWHANHLPVSREG